MQVNIYTDASFNSKTNIGRCAIIIKAANGKTINKFAEHFQCNTSYEAEFLAINEAIEYIFTEYHGFNTITKINLFNDCKNTCDLINHRDYIHIINSGKLAIKNIDISKKIQLYCKIQMIKQNINLNIIWIPRELNKDADKLSKMYNNSRVIKRSKCK